MANKARINIGWEGVFEVYPKYNIRNSFKIPLLLNTIILLCLYFSNIETKSIIDSVCNTIITICPTLLGLILTGYTLIIGFGASPLMEPLTRPKQSLETIECLKKKDINNCSECSTATICNHNYKFSLFQKLNATFAIVIGAISLTIGMGVFIKYISDLNLPFIFNSIFRDLFNGIILFILLLLLFYSIFSIKDIVSNIFNLGQFTQKVMDQKFSKDKNTSI